MYRALLVLVAACVETAAPPDVQITPSFAYRLAVQWWDPPRDWPAEPTIYIDGAARTFLEIARVEQPEPHLVELRYGNDVVHSMTIDAPPPCNHPDVITRIDEDVAAFRNGDLMYGGTSGYRGDSYSCVGEPDYPACTRFCRPGESGLPDKRCEVVIAHRQPLATFEQCGAIGPRKENESCTFMAAADGLHDDCGDGLVCLEGVCRRWTFKLFFEQAPDCDFIPGYPAEVRLCRSPSP